MITLKVIIQELKRRVTLIGSGKETTRNFKLFDS